MKRHECFKLECWSPVITRLASGKGHQPPGRGPLGEAPWTGSRAGVSVGGALGGLGNPSRAQPEREVADSRNVEEERGDF